MKVGCETVAQLLREIVAHGSIELDDRQGWDEAYAGDVRFRFGEWRITFFNDCDQVDYVDSVERDNGDSGDFDDWYSDNPVYRLSQADLKRLEQILKDARSPSS